MGLLRTLRPIKKYFFRRFSWRWGYWMYSSPWLLDLDRLVKKEIQMAVDTARARQPGAPIYLFADSSISPEPGIQLLTTLEELTVLPSPAAVVLACNSDELALAAVQEIRRHPGVAYYGAYHLTPTARYFHRDEAARKTLKACYEANPARFELPDLENIAQALRATRQLPGSYVEVGVFTGDSAYFALGYMERANIQRDCYFLDTFSGFDYDQAAKSSDRLWVNTHGNTSREAVAQRLSVFRAPHQVIKSNIITDALPSKIQKIAVCNIDVDLYEAVVAGLAKVAPLMTSGGIIIIEDQGHTPMLIGAYVAVREFLDSEAGNAFLPIELNSGQMFLVKIQK